MKQYVIYELTPCKPCKGTGQRKSLNGADKKICLTCNGRGVEYVIRDFREVLKEVMDEGRG